MSVTEQAKAELALINMDAGDTAAILDIMKTFFSRWDSGGAVSVMLPVLVRCLRGQPLTPLTGAEDEWIDRSECSDTPLQQNARCSSVFRGRYDADSEWGAYDVDLPDGANIITFPYSPETRTDVVTMFEVMTGG